MGAAGAIGAGTSAVSGILNIAGDIVQMVRNGESDAAIKAAIKNAYGIEIPDQELLKIKAQEVVPERDIATPETRAAQMDALRRLSGIAASGGMDPQSIDALQRAEESAQRNFQNNSAAIMRDQMARGVANSGSTMAANIAGAQASANMLNRSGVQAAGDARARALQAIAESGRLGGNIASADDERAARNKEAREKIRLFNSEAALRAATTTADNLLARSGAMTNRANAISGAAGKFADAGADRGKPLKDMGDTVGRTGAGLSKFAKK